MTEQQTEYAATAGAGVYEHLAAPFDVTFRDLRGGVELEYITGEQVTTRLNEALGFMAWSFQVIEHGIHPEADECWALGRLTVSVDGQEITRDQFGSQKVKRSRSSGTPLDIGFDLKGAGTDALKKCASLIGVGLYLWKKTAPGTAPGNAPAASGPRLMPSSGDGVSLTCDVCGESLTDTRFKDGTNWDPDQLATFGRRKHSQVLCMTHYREANQAKRRAEEALSQVPF